VNHVREKCFGGGSFHRPAAGENHHVIRATTGDTEIMGYQDDGHCQLCLQVCE
jgi:hypothetical protein